MEEDLDVVTRGLEVAEDSGLWDVPDDDTL